MHFSTAGWFLSTQKYLLLETRRAIFIQSQKKDCDICLNIKFLQENERFVIPENKGVCKVGR